MSKAKHADTYDPKYFDWLREQEAEFNKMDVREHFSSWLMQKCYTLQSENAALREEGRRQWFMAHSGECENLNYGEHTGECTWPMPKILEGKC
jgi:hypothetical protein